MKLAAGPSLTRKQILIVSLLLGALASFYMATIREGHPWGDDFAMYILQASNLARGTPSADTGYVYNPHLTDLGPRRYPPVFPAFLAPVYRLFGLDLRAMKSEQIVFLIVFLALLPFTFPSFGGFAEACTVILVLGLNPLVRSQADMILSDLLFCVFLCLATLAAERRGSAMAAGILIWLASGVRTIGFLLLPALLLWDLIRLRRLTRFSIVAAVWAAALAVAQAVILGGDASYADTFAIRIRPLENLRLYASTLGDVFDNGSSRAAALLLGASAGALAAIGYWVTARREIRLWHVLAPLYIALILIWPANQGFRFLLPLLPFCFFLALAGARAVAERWNPLARRLLPGLLVLAICASYARVYASSSFGPVMDGPGMPAFADLCRHLRAGTDAADVVIFRKPRVLALFAGRRAAAYHQPGNFAELAEYMRSIGARYIVSGNVFEEDRVYLERFIEHYRTKLEPVYRNDVFRLYRLID